MFCPEEADITPRFPTFWEVQEPLCPNWDFLQTAFKPSQFSTSNVLNNSLITRPLNSWFPSVKQQLYHGFCWQCVYLAKGIFVPPSVFHGAVVLLSSVLAVCLGICSKNQKSQCPYNTFTYICVPITFNFFLHQDLWTLLEIINELCFSVITFSVSVYCKSILCAEENLQRKASSLNKSPCPRYKRPSFRGQLQGYLHESSAIYMILYNF